MLMLILLQAGSPRRQRGVRGRNGRRRLTVQASTAPPCRELLASMRPCRARPRWRLFRLAETRAAAVNSTLQPSEYGRGAVCLRVLGVQTVVVTANPITH